MKKILLALILLSAPLSAATWEYKGVIRPPDDATPGDPQSGFSYGMQGLTYYASCGSYTDPSSGDGYPGCLCGQMNAAKGGDKWGCWDIKPPVVPTSRNQAYYDAMTTPSFLFSAFHPSQGDSTVTNDDCTAEGFPYRCCTGSKAGSCGIIDILDEQHQAEGTTSGIEKTTPYNVNNHCTAAGVPYACCTAENTGPCVGDKWAAWDIPGLVFYSGDNYITTCGHDWYNTAGTDHVTHCWGNAYTVGGVGPGEGAEGAWGMVGTANESDHSQPLSAHARRVGWYLGTIPQDWANTNLSAGGTQYCFTGMHRQSGGQSSAGPTLYAFPCAKPGTSITNWIGPDIQTVPLLGYNNVSPNYNYPENDGSYGETEWPKHNPRSQCRDGVWIDTDTDLIAFNCRIGGSIWWYGHQDIYDEPRIAEPYYINHRNVCAYNLGTPVWQSTTAQHTKGDDCSAEWAAYGPDVSEIPVTTFSDPCNSTKGYHAVNLTAPYQSMEIQFYAASDLALVAAGTSDPQDIIPTETLAVDYSSIAWGSCGEAGGLTWDGSNLYAAEEFGSNSDSIIHVWNLTGQEPPPPEVNPDSSLAGGGVEAGGIN